MPQTIFYLLKKIYRVWEFPALHRRALEPSDFPCCRPHYMLGNLIWTELLKIESSVL